MCVFSINTYTPHLRDTLNIPNTKNKILTSMHESVSYIVFRLRGKKTFYLYSLCLTGKTVIVTSATVAPSIMRMEPSLGR